MQTNPSTGSGQATASTTTYFIGNYYEVVETYTGTQVTKYYFAGTQRIAMRKNGVLNYLLSDHLGSTSLVTDASGNVVNQTQYKAWGEERYSSGSEVTRYQYTGQYSYAADFGLMFYNARWYDSSLGRFTSADTIVPAGVQGYDRYAYANNNPVKYTDPSGHDPSLNNCDYAGLCDAEGNSLPIQTTVPAPVVIGACGVGAGNCNQPVPGYNQGQGTSNEIPLKPYADSAGSSYMPVGIDKYLNGKSLNPKHDQALEILLIIRNAKGKVYLVGHSAGADAVIWAVDMAISEGLGDKIAGVAVLDPYFQIKETDGPQANQWVSLQERADRVASALPGRVFLGDTLNDYDVNTRQAIDINIPGAAGNDNPPYPYTHLQLANANQVFTDIQNTIGWLK